MPDTTDLHAVASERSLGGCPVKHYEVANHQPAGEHWRDTDALREECPVFWNTLAQGFWVVTRYDLVKEMYQTPELFSSESFTAWEPNPPYRFVPTQIDPPEHIKYRQILNPKFAPGAVGRAEGTAREIARRLIAEIRPTGRCDFVADFAIRYPTEVYLVVIGLPPSDADFLVPWVEDFFAGLHDNPDKKPGMVAALAGIREYFTELLADRRAMPRDPEHDLVSHLLQSTKDGEPLSDTEMLDMCTVLVLAGLDTTRGQLGFLFRYLADHPTDRQRLIDDPSLVPNAVEESLRVHSIMIGDSRKVTRDVDFHGYPLKRGDMVMGLVSAANRDPRHYDRADEFVIDRSGAHHFGFAGGPHRCLGAHLARREMQIALDEWMRAIPDFRIEEGAALMERGGMMTLLSLPLVWEV